MQTVSIRYLGTKRPKVVDLPIGMTALSEKTGEVVCNPVGEFPADEAQRLLSLAGSSGLYMLESEYQAKQKSGAKAAPSADDEAKKEAQRERGRQLAAAQKAKKEAAAKAAAKAAKKASKKGKPAVNQPAGGDPPQQ